MEFIENMYIGEGIKSPEKIIDMLKNKKTVTNVYCICIDMNANSLMEILYSHEIHKQVYKDKNYIIIGLAYGKDEAKKIVCEIIKKAYDYDNSLVNVKDFIYNTLVKRGDI